MSASTAEISDYELEAIERAAFERDYRDYCNSRSTSSDPLTDQDLWRHIKNHAGGLRRSRKYWDTNLSWRENRAAFRYLDRGWEKGRSMDELAEEVGMEWPWYGINDGHDLWEWMQRTRRC
jgi:hypothetical protein